MGPGKNLCPCNIILITAVEKRSCGCNIGFSGPRGGTKGAPMCNSESLGMCMVDFSGGMGTGINSGGRNMLLTHEYAAVGVCNYFQAYGP